MMFDISQITQGDVTHAMIMKNADGETTGFLDRHTHIPVPYLQEYARPIMRNMVKHGRRDPIAPAVSLIKAGDLPMPGGWQPAV